MNDQNSANTSDAQTSGGRPEEAYGQKASECQTPGTPQAQQPYNAGAPAPSCGAPYPAHSVLQQPYSTPQLQQPYGSQPTQQPYQPQAHEQGAPHPPYPNAQAPYPYMAQSAYPGAQTPPSYAAQPAPQPAKKKVWPWVLGACILAVLLTFGGCVGCAACSSAVIGKGILLLDNKNHSGDSYDGNRDYGYGNDGSNGYDSQTQTYTKGEIEVLLSDQYGLTFGSAKNNQCAPGIYEVGKDIEPGLYYLEGSQTEESNYFTFERVENSNVYTLDDSVVYLGHYFVELSEGSIIAFAGISGTTMKPATETALGIAAPYPSGLYRVGIDISAGTYRVHVPADVSAATNQESAAYVMKDLFFNDDSIIDTKYVIAGSMQTITVEDGQYVELFNATMEPVQE